MNWKQDLRRLVRVLSFLKMWRVRYFAGMASMLGFGFLSDYLMSLMLSRLMDAAQAGDSPALISTAVVFTVLSLLSILAYITGFFFWASSTSRALRVMGESLFNRFLHLPVDRMSGAHSGDMLSRFSSDTDRMSSVMTWGLMTPLMMVFNLVSGSVVIFATSWKLGLLLVALGVLGFLGTARYAGPMRKQSELVQKAIGRMTGRFVDFVAGMRVIRLYHLAAMFTERFLDVNGEVRSLGLRRVAINAKIRAVIGVLSIGQLVLTPVLGLYLITRGELTLGQLFFVFSMSWGVVYGLQGIGNALNGLQRSLAGIDRIMEVLEAPLEQETYGQAAPDPSRGEAVVFDDVRFAYRKEEPVLNGVSFAVPRGCMAAFVGASGGGKTTILKLLLQMNNECGGEIRLFGRRLREYSLDALRRTVAYVPQTPFLFNATVARNIEWGRPGATREDIEAAARAANAHDFITALPDGYDTKVGERGVQLSGGQQQRIAIARAIIKDAPVLLLDEATSALDSESEAQIQLALEALRGTRTVLIVAHRLSTIAGADVIFAMDGGRIAEWGRHEALLESNGVYARFIRQYRAGCQ